MSDLLRYAELYETKEFLVGDPSWFMHQVDGVENQETMAFLASSLSYGNRKQFMPKIQQLLDWSAGEPYQWVQQGRFAEHFRTRDTDCFYRLYNSSVMYGFLKAFQELLQDYGSLGKYVRQNATDGFMAVEAICNYFARKGVSVVVPKNTQSACKRVCMFLRWMVRDNSPVDLGLWSDFIDKKTLIIPLDTHVLQQSQKMGLIKSKTASMTTARRLTAALSKIFPNDPLRGDFALFGEGVRRS